MSSNKPAIIVIGAPGVPKGMGTLACEHCKAKHPAQLSTCVTVKQLGDKAPPVICWTCLGKLPPSARTEISGIREGLKRMGLD